MNNIKQIDFIVLAGIAWMDSRKVKYKRDRNVIYIHNFADNIQVPNVNAIIMVEE